MFTKTEADNWVQNHGGKDAKIFACQPRVTDGISKKEAIRKNLQYAVSLSPQEGLYCEFGVRDGRSFRFIQESMSANKTLHGFDCWDGLPEEWHLSKTHSKGILKTLQIPENNHNSCYWSGLFADTIPQFKNKHKENLAFCHIDGDLYSSCNDVLYGLDDRIVPDTVLVFDEFHAFETADLGKWSNVWNHELKSLSEWCESKNREVEMISRTDWMQATFKVLK